jgi:hypothetical protein
MIQHRRKLGVADSHDLLSRWPVRIETSVVQLDKEEQWRGARGRSGGETMEKKDSEVGDGFVSGERENGEEEHARPPGFLRPCWVALGMFRWDLHSLHKWKK